MTKIIGGLGDRQGRLCPAYTHDDMGNLLGEKAYQARFTPANFLPADSLAITMKWSYLHDLKSTGDKDGRQDREYQCRAAT